MKKSPKKLVLNRETLASLDKSLLGKVAGGTDTQNQWCYVSGTNCDISICICQ